MISLIKAYSVIDDERFDKKYTKHQLLIDGGSICFLKAN